MTNQQTNKNNKQNQISNQMKQTNKQKKKYWKTKSTAMKLLKYIISLKCVSYESWSQLTDNKKFKSALLITTT